MTDLDALRRLLQMDANLDILFGQRAVGLGYLAQARLDERLEEQRRLAAEGRPERIGALLLRHGELTAEQCGAILDAQGVRPDQGPQRPGPGPGARIDRYRILRVVGSGGMGVVYEAVDETLGRRVALKVLRPTIATPDVLERFRREAATAAALRHPNIVAVHEVGRVRDEAGEETHYICMDFVEGRTLADVVRRGDVPVPRRVEMIEKIARALHHAHEAGIVHRDIKPGNIMVAPDGEPVLADFGLARSLREAHHLTRTGALVGTPLYMAPEQVQGRSHEIDRRTDVYALGVTLYEATTGRPPFVGRTAADLYHRIVGEEPPPPRTLNAAVNVDLETVILKAMDKDRGRRYPDALALAEDLRRYRQGEPIHARPPSVVHLLRRAVARRRGVWATAVAGFVVVALVLGVLIPRLRESHTRNLDLMREIAEANLGFALESRRIGNLAGMQAYAAKVEEACRRVMRNAPERPEPHYYLGRMHRALLHIDEAIAEQDRALKKAPDFVPARYDRGLLRCQRYDERIDRLRRQWLRRRAEHVAGRAGQIAGGEPTRAQLEDKDAARWRTDAEADLAAAGTTAARALLAWLQGDARAAELFEKAAQESGDASELFEWRGRLARDSGDFDDAADWYGRGIERDRGYLTLRRARIEIRLEQARRARDPAPRFAEALEDCDELLKLGADDPATRLARARVQIDRGNHAMRRGVDPTGDYRGALDDIGRARPQSAETLLYEGGARLNLAQHAADRGEDAGADLQAAVDAFRAAVELDRENPEIWMSLGGALANLGNAAARRGADPALYFAESLECDMRVVRLQPENAEAWASRGTTRFRAAQHALARNEDPTSLLDEAIKDFNEAIQLQPHAAYYRDRGRARALLALHAGRSGEEPDALFREAFRDLDLAIERDARDFEAFRLRGATWTNYGNQRVQHGLDPRPEYENAVRDFGRSLGLNDQDADSWDGRGTVLGAWMRHLVTRPDHDPRVVRELYVQLKSDLAQFERAQVPPVLHRWRRPGALPPSRSSGRPAAGQRPTRFRTSRSSLQVDVSVDPILHGPGTCQGLEAGAVGLNHPDVVVRLEDETLAVGRPAESALGVCFGGDEL